MCGMGMLEWGSQESGPRVGMGEPSFCRTGCVWYGDAGVGIPGNRSRDRLGMVSVVVSLLSYTFYLRFYFLRDMEPFEDLKWMQG